MVNCPLCDAVMDVDEDDLDEGHAAKQNGLRHQLEAMQNNTEQAEEVNQRAQRAPAASRTEKSTSPRVM